MVQARSIFSQNKLTSFILLSLGAHLLLFLCFKADLETSFSSPEKAVVRLKTVKPAVVDDENVPVPIPIEKPIAVEKTAEPKLLPAPPEAVILNKIESFSSLSVKRPAPTASSVTDSAVARGPQTVQFSTASIGARVPKPGYPDIAKRWGHEGLVAVKIFIAEDGTVAKVELLESSGFMELDDAALQVILSKWKFAAAGYEIRTVKEFEFKLRR